MRDEKEGVLIWGEQKKRTKEFANRVRVIDMNQVSKLVFTNGFRCVFCAFHSSFRLNSVMDNDKGMSGVDRTII